MTPIPAFILGILLPTLTGYLIVRTAEQRADILSWPERIGFALLLGPTWTIWLSALFSLWTGLALSLGLLLAVQLLALGSRFFWLKRGKIRLLPPRDQIRKISPQWLQIGLWSLLIVSILKVLVLASVLTVSVPTFFDDSHDNWNYRAKIIVETQHIPLALPGDAAVGGGVASYPATLPLLKAWLVDLNGQWNEGLVNSVQLIWFAAVVLIVGGALSRRRGLAWGLAGATALLGLPLLIIHGLTAYADLFLAAHVLAVVLAIVEAEQAESREAFLSWITLSIITLALLPALKNEGLAVFLPSCLLFLGLALWKSWRRNESTTKDLATIAGALAVLGAVTTLPWLIFKWQNGLAFGNAHVIGQASFGWQSGVLSAAAYHLFSEGNWLILPGLALGLLIIRHKVAFGPHFQILTVACLWLTAGLTALFLFDSDLGHEALRQTGYGRAMVQVAPLWLFLVFSLLPNSTRHEA